MTINMMLFNIFIIFYLIYIIKFIKTISLFDLFVGFIIIISMYVFFLFITDIIINFYNFTSYIEITLNAFGEEASRIIFIFIIIHIYNLYNKIWNISVVVGILFSLFEILQLYFPLFYVVTMHTITALATDKTVHIDIAGSSEVVSLLELPAPLFIFSLLSIFGRTFFHIYAGYVGVLGIIHRKWIIPLNVMGVHILHNIVAYFFQSSFENVKQLAPMATVLHFMAFLAVYIIYFIALRGKDEAQNLRSDKIPKRVSSVRPPND